MVDSCRHCLACDDGLEQYCEDPLVLKVNHSEADLAGVAHSLWSSRAGTPYSLS